MRAHRLLRRQSGAALVELALVLPTLLVLMLTVSELGRAVWQYKMLAQAVREAARYVSLQTPGTGLEQARNLVLKGSLSGASGTPGLAAVPSVQVRWQRQGSLALVTVTASGYAFESLVSSWWGLPFGRIPFGDISATLRAASCGSVC